MQNDDVTVCSSCEAEIIWALTPKQRKMPLDATPLTGWDDLRGKFVLRNGVAITAQTAMPIADEPVYVSHFATCPNAASHRRDRSRASA